MSSIAFTMKSSQQSTTFLDLQIYKGSRFRREGILDVKLFTKDTNQQSFLHFSSCHPQNTFNTIVRGELLRALRCTSDVTIYLETVDRLISKFQERGYPRVLLLREADKFNHGQRQGLLERKEKQQLQPDVTIFTTTHHPSLTSSAVRRVLSDEETPFRPMVVRRRAPSHKDRLVRARSDVIHNSSSTTCSYGRITPNNIS